MKKIFSFLAAAAMLFAASCTKDNVGTDNGNDTQVTFNLSLEGQSGTRAIGDGAGVTKLFYYIFDAEGKRLNHYDYAADFSTVTPKIQLAKDQTYKAVFWAQKETNAYTVEAVGVDGTVNIKVNYAENANDEARDAFYGVVEFTVTGSERIDVLLTRPFAQLNVGVTEADYEAAKNSGVIITKSWAKVSGVYNTLNLFDGSVSGGETEEIEFTLNTIPNEKLVVDSVEYEYLSMNYVLVGAKKNVAAEFRFETEDGSKGINFNSGLDVVPVERNYRTNLVGQILTGNLDFNVTIDADFYGDHNISGIVSANDQQAVNNALKNREVHTIMLPAGEFTIDLYSQALEKNTLNIIGTTGTKVEFADQQVRMALFKNFRIENCEILRMATKSWGMLVFGGGNKADGVYTVSNCTFNGVGTQGIYINENNSGATYNIENCTFEGNFGNEGAITIQGNQNVECNVNVNGCTFNDIPATSHRIYVTNNTTIYYDFNLNTDLKASTAYEIYMFANLGFETINLEDGEYDVYGCRGKTLTLNGSKNAVLFLNNDGEDGCDYAFGDSGTGVGNITFNGLTINTLQNTGNYKGYAYMKGTFNNCDFVGAYSLNSATDFTFNACTFDFKGGYFWTWGAKSVIFDGCTFNGDSRNILAHGYESTEITINNCNFAATVVGKTGAGDPTACVEIDPADTNTYTINFTGTNTKSDKYAGWTRIKDGSTGHTITGAE